MLVNILSTDAQSGVELIAGVAGQSIVVDQIVISSDTALQATVSDGIKTFLEAHLSASGLPFVLTKPRTYSAQMRTYAGSPLTITTDASGTVAVFVAYHFEAADADATPFVLTIGETPFAPQLTWTRSGTPGVDQIFRDQGLGFGLVGEQINDFTFTDPDSITAGNIWGYKIVSGGRESNQAFVSRDFLLLGPSVSYPKLIIEFADLACNDITTVTRVNLSGLRHVVGSAYFDVSMVLPSLTLESLLTIGVDFRGNAGSITSLSAPVLTDVGGDLYFDACTGLVTVNLPSLVFRNGQTATFDSCALSAASIEHLLARVIASGVTSLTITFDGGTSAALTELSVQGQADYAAAVLAGNTITINP